MTQQGKNKRVSRACISCRSRKTRCDLDSNGSPGHPPCRKCVEDQRECVLATSRRGGRRIRKAKPLVAEDQGAASSGSFTEKLASPLPQQQQTQTQDSAAVLAGFNAITQADRDVLEDWNASRQTSTWTRDGSPARTDASQSPSRRSSVALEGHITATDLLNPSDALDLLAQVADLDTSAHSKQARLQKNGHPPQKDHGSSVRYPPISAGALGFADATTLVQYYHRNFHPFFPVAHKSVFEGNVAECIEKEPHLLTAILTVASKDDPSWATAHEACSRHMESLLSRLIYGGVTTVGSVEALLILAEWAPQPPHELSSIGCGKEDYGAWMLVGAAIRLGYLQKLEQTGLHDEGDTPSESFDRKRIAWAACYMSDRQVAIRLGKGFWSRGPGPSTNLRAADFPSLQSQKAGSDNLGLLFQAHLELTQLFGNAHDILYSSTSHREQLYVGGEYVRYIDDFASVLRNWKLVWGICSFTPHVKASLILSYDFLRLYINAFAFQATLNRAAAKLRKSPNKNSVTGPLFSDLAAAPDARFIYESIDAANSLLSILNSFIDPVAGLKFMPLKYSLFVIYAATFLFKAWLAGAISNEGIAGVRRAILATITQLQKSSTSTQSIGHRYARSLRLLWRKRSAKHTASRNTHSQPPVAPESKQVSAAPQEHPDTTQQNALNMSGPEFDALNGFSWRDLDSLGQYISNEASMYAADGVLTTPEFDSEHGTNSIEGIPVDFGYHNLWNGGDIIF